MKKQNGITLIALVITIIVLLILTGVSINLVIGQNGVVGKANEATNKANRGTTLEQASIILTNWKTENVLDGIPYEGRTAQTETGADIMCFEDQFIVIDNEKIYSTIITDTEIGTFIEETNNTTSQIYKAMHPKIPTGYQHVTGEWNTGYVIKEKSTGDEFVWIPVLHESVFQKKSGIRNQHMSAQNVANHGEDVVSLYVTGDDYAGNAWITSAEIEKTTVNNSGGFYVSRYEIGRDNVERNASPTKLQESNALSVTVKSQYGLEPVRSVTQEAAVKIANNWKKGTDVQSGLITGTQWDAMCKFIGWSICDSACTTWGNYYNVKSKVYTNAIWHSGTRAGGKNLLDWHNSAITKTASNSTDAEIVFATGTFVSVQGKTTDKNNIYDIAGNVLEWTTETIHRDAAIRIARGGATNSKGNDVIATHRAGSGSKTGSAWNMGFRAVLYVK